MQSSRYSSAAVFPETCRIHSASESTDSVFPVASRSAGNLDGWTEGSKRSRYIKVVRIFCRQMGRRGIRRRFVWFRRQDLAGSVWLPAQRSDETAGTLSAYRPRHYRNDRDRGRSENVHKAMGFRKEKLVSAVERRIFTGWMERPCRRSVRTHR